VFVADGRFHLEAALIANPSVPSYRYDPYGKRMTSEGYDHAGMRADRRVAVEAGAAASRWGLILGTLGRQGSPAVLARLEAAAKAAGKSVFTLCVSEIKPASLKAFGGSVEAWVQVACPRLSIDWGAGFGSIPLLTPYEAHVALGLAPPWWEGEGSPYPMDYYARDAGPWGNYWKPPKSGLNR
jgi:2-(3-amino-3-carboxypropyl)histidine synthase